MLAVKDVASVVDGGGGDACASMLDAGGDDDELMIQKNMRTQNSKNVEEKSEIGRREQRNIEDNER